MATYQADGKIIRKLPIKTKVEGGTSYELGFPVCTLSEYVEDQSEAVAELLNRGEAYGKLRMALTPSAETKSAYMGEFQFHKTYAGDDDGDEYTVNMIVPWDTIKDIMKAISNFAEEC